MVLHHANMKLARQQNERTEAQQGIDQETRRVDPGKESGRNVVGLLGLIDQITNPAKQVKGRIKPNGEKGDQLDDRLGCDCKNEPIMVLGGVCVACAEQYCKQGEQDRDKKTRCRQGAPSSPTTLGWTRTIMVSTVVEIAFSCRAI